VKRRPGAGIPEQCRLALVGDTDPGETFRRQSGFVERFSDDRASVAPDFVGVVLDPSGLRVDLRVLFLGQSDDHAVAVEHDKARARRSLVDGADQGGHGVLITPQPGGAGSEG
jgi:hypothetical protein